MGIIFSYSFCVLVPSYKSQFFQRFVALFWASREHFWRDEKARLLFSATLWFCQYSADQFHSFKQLDKFARILRLSNHQWRVCWDDKIDSLMSRDLTWITVSCLETRVTCRQSGKTIYTEFKPYTPLQTLNPFSFFLFCICSYFSCMPTSVCVLIKNRHLYSRTNKGLERKQSLRGSESNQRTTAVSCP